MTRKDLEEFPRRKLFQRFLVGAAVATGPIVLDAKEILAPPPVETLMDIISKLEARVRTLENKIENHSVVPSYATIASYTTFHCYSSSYFKKIP